MKIFQKAKDGGPDSPVTAYFLIEWKRVFSIALLHFGGTREAFHSHAFNAVTLWIKGRVNEVVRKPYPYGGESHLWASWQLKYTPRGLMHKIIPVGSAWALTFRGPWAKTWQELRPDGLVTLSTGRKVVSA